MKDDSASDGNYLEYVDAHLVPASDEFFVETHEPKRFRAAYHHHASLEINFLIGCDLVYSFSGTSVTVPRRRLTVFWGAVPHGVADVIGTGKIVNVYVSLFQTLKWGLPKQFTDKIISGAVISALPSNPTDSVILPRWAAEYRNGGAMWRNLLLGEIEMRLRRLALEGYVELLPGVAETDLDVSRVPSMRYIDMMLRFIADNYASPITVKDVADHVSLSPSYAMALFQRTIGVPIKRHITRVRISHAQMLLANSNLKILGVAMDSGFRSLSSFYHAFKRLTDKSPAAFRAATRE